MTMPVIAPGEQVIELMIPASKVGLIIGKCSGGILSVIKVGDTPIHRCILIASKRKNNNFIKCPGFSDVAIML